MSDYLNQFIKPELLILVPVLYLIGIVIKNSKAPDRLIPYILGGISIILSAIWVFATCPINNWQGVLAAVFTTITQGILAAGASVYVNQLIKQAKKADEDKPEKSNNQKEPEQLNI